MVDGVKLSVCANLRFCFADKWQVSSCVLTWVYNTLDKQKLLNKVKLLMILTG